MSSSRALVEQFDDLLAASLERETGPLFFDVTIHAHVYGRPAGAWTFDTMMQKAKATRGVWIGTRREAAKHALNYWS